MNQQTASERLHGMKSQTPAGTESGRTTAPDIASALSSAGSQKKRRLSGIKAKVL